MLYQRPTFTVPASSGHTEKMKAVCAQHGHMDPLDRWGKCWRCGEKIISHLEPAIVVTATARRADLEDLEVSATLQASPLKRAALAAGYRSGLEDSEADIKAIYDRVASYEFAPGWCGMTEGPRVPDAPIGPQAERVDSIDPWKWNVAHLDGIPTSVHPLTTSTPTPFDGPIGPETGE